MRDEELLEQNHVTTVEQLEKQIKTLEGELKRVMKGNHDEEFLLRKEFRITSTEHDTNMK